MQHRTFSARYLKTRPRETAVTEPLLEVRPRTRGECRPGVGLRPCPWVGCVHHLAVDVAPNGSLKIRAPRLAAQGYNPAQHLATVLDTIVDDLCEAEHSCSLDVADDAEHLPLEYVGELLGMTRQRAEQIEQSALHKLKNYIKLPILREYLDP